MKLHEALRSRVTVHRYLPGEVPESALLRAIEMAQAAPNHRCTFPWRFYVLGAEARERLAAIQAGLKGTALSDARAKFLAPGLCLAVTCRKSADAVRAREDAAAVSAAIENLMLSLWADGFGTKWATGRLVEQPATYEALGLDPGSEAITGLVWGGVPAELPPKPPRPALEEVLRRLP